MECQETSKCNTTAQFMRAGVSFAACLGSVIAASAQEDNVIAGVFAIGAISSLVYSATNLNDGVVTCNRINRAKRSFTEHAQATQKQLEV